VKKAVVVPLLALALAGCGSANPPSDTFDDQTVNGTRCITHREAMACDFSHVETPAPPANAGPTAPPEVPGPFPPLPTDVPAPEPTPTDIPTP
jgi:hypothetical protein